MGADPNAIGVQISPDRTAAELIIPPGVDRAMLSVAVCEGFVREAGVEVTAFTHGAIEALLAQDADGRPLRGVVARATPPQHGEDGRIEWSEFKPATDTPQAEPPDAKRSYYECSAFVMVKPGEVVGQIHRPTLGEDGRDVLGKVLMARAGKDQPLQLDETILCDGSGKLIAQAEGVLIRKGASACIRPVLDIGEYVDFSTGNIDFRGDVHIRKGVRDLFTVRSTGTVEVLGLIEAATIIAGTDLVARGGFAGRERGRAQCGRNFLGKYVDNVEGEVRGDLCIDREVINSFLVVHGGVNMSHGAIIGGRVVATGRVHIGTLGSGGAVATEIVIGGVPRLEPMQGRLKDLIDRLRDRQELIRTQQAQLETLLGKRRPTASDKERQTEMIFELSNIATMLAKAVPACDALNARINALRTVEVVVERRVFPGVVIVLGNQQYQITSELRGPLRIAKDETGALVYYRGEQRAGPLVQVADLRAAA